VIHELGHAIPALLLTNDKVTVYMGSWGNPEKSLHLQFGRLECFFKFNLFYWKGGLCVPHEKTISFRDNFIITIFGPLLSLIVAGVGVTALLLYDFGDIGNLIIFALVFSCALDFWHNIVPRNEDITLYDGRIVYNDGSQLLSLLKYRKVYDLPTKAVDCYNKKDYKTAATLSEKCIEAFPEQQEWYRIAISSYLYENQAKEAVRIQDSYSEKFEDSFEEIDFLHLGSVEICRDDFKKSLEAFEKAYAINQNNIYTFNGIGFVLSMLGEHEKAIEQFNKALLEESHFEEIYTTTLTAHIYCNRGYTKFELGQIEEGLADTQKSLELDATNAYVYRNFGLYYFYTNDHHKANEFYQKAVKMEPEIPYIQELITKNSSKLKD
jgi:tetratricopeptide (TPR) repeat protein